MAGDLRSPRKRALEIGTDSSKFPADLPYDTQAGHPTGSSAVVSNGVYQEQPPNINAGGGALPNTPSPFRIGGN